MPLGLARPLGRFGLGFATRSNGPGQAFAACNRRVTESRGVLQRCRVRFPLQPVASLGGIQGANSAYFGTTSDYIGISNLRMP